MKTFEYNYEDIFQDVEGDPDNVLLTIPEEVCNIMGIVPGDTVKFELINDALHIRKVDNGTKTDPYPTGS